MHLALSIYNFMDVPETPMRSMGVRRYEPYLHFCLERSDDREIADDKTFVRNSYTPICSVGMKKGRVISDPAFAL